MKNTDVLDRSIPEETITKPEAISVIKEELDKLEKETGNPNIKEQFDQMLKRRTAQSF